MQPDYNLNSNDQLTALVKSNGIKSWNILTQFIENLPYGRNENRTNLGLVLTEKKGTCSSKHALLKRIADLNDVPNVNLFIGIYKMNALNTPKIGLELTNYSINFIPEAHCYLKIEGQRVDFTTKKSEFKNIESDLIQEKKITPEQVSEFKVNYHKSFIKNWLSTTNSKFELEQIWHIRETCIKNLTD